MPTDEELQGDVRRIARAVGLRRRVSRLGGLHGETTHEPMGVRHTWAARAPRDGLHRRADQGHGLHLEVSGVAAAEEEVTQRRP